MFALLTSSGRFDLLEKTLSSLCKNQNQKLRIIIHDDGLSHTGQNSALEFLINSTEDKYALMLEDDWEFDNSYDWIEASIKIMEADPSIIKVLCRKDSPHPCNHDLNFESIKYGHVNPWVSQDNTLWNGFSWNPGITRIDLIKKFIPFPKWEQELAKNIYDAGYKVAELENGIYKHIGDGRSTHE